MTRTAELQADLRTDTPAYGLTASTVVALPPSDLDSSTTRMRLYINGVLVERTYDPELEA